MKRFVLLTTCAALVACQETGTPPVLAPSSSAVRATASIDPALASALATAAADTRLEVVLRFDRAVTTAEAVGAALQEFGAGVIGFGHLPLIAALATPAEIQAATTLAGVEGVELATVEHPLNLEGVRSVQADAVHALGYTGKGVGVAILDTGIDGSHPDVPYPQKTVQNVKAYANSKDVYEFGGRDSLTGLKTPKPLKKGYEIWLENIRNTDNNSGHGTHVAATAAGTGAASGGKYAGVAPDAHLVGISAAEGGVFPSLFILAGYDYILEHRKDYNIQVVNNSWGSSPAKFNPNSAINIATREAHDAGVTVVFAGGNDGPAENTMNPRAIAPWVIAVAAGCKLGVDPTGSRAHCVEGDGRDSILAYFSSRGIPGDTLYTPDITAPGVHIVSARATMGIQVWANALTHDARICAIATEHVTSYTCISGTSMATPNVTGIAALLEQVTGGKITPDQTLQVLQATARRYPRYGAWEVGAGYADALAAVNALRR